MARDYKVNEIEESQAADSPANTRSMTRDALFFHWGVFFAAYTRYTDSPGSNAPDKKWQSTMLVAAQPARNGYWRPVVWHVRTRKRSVKMRYTKTPPST